MPFEYVDDQPKSPRYQFVEDAPVSVKAGSVLNDIPRQLGLTARYGIEGLANTAQVFTEPLRYLTDKLTPNRDGVEKSAPIGVLATRAADWMGLPSPQGANERVIGDATRLVAGSGGLAGGANAASSLTSGLVKKSLQFLAANPLQQISSAGGSGLAGGASREAGGDAIDQGTASFIGGIAGGKASDIANGATNLAKSLFSKGMTTQQFDVKISNALQQAGVDYSQVPERVRQSMRQELATALNADKSIDPAAVSRLLDFKQSGVTPTLGMISQNPVQITREMNLAKIGANSGDGALHGLPMIQNQNNAKLIENLNALGANRGDTLAAGEHVASSVLGTQSGLRSAEQSAWDAAKSSPGYKQPISAQAISDINGALGEQGLMPFMSPSISKYMDAFQNGRPFTPQDYRNLQSMLSREVTKGGNEGAAAGLAARILRDSDLQPTGLQSTGSSIVTKGMGAGMRNADNAATDSIDAVNSARKATKAAYSYEDSNPLVRSVLSGGATSDPQRIAQRFVIGGTANEAADLVSQLGPNGLAPVKDAIINNLKSKALSGAADETGKFSQSAFNKALNDIGDRKLSMLFSPEEITALRSNARASALMQSQPIGSAVNNSNSGALLFGRGVDLLNKLPVVGPMAGPALKNIEISYGNRQAANISSGLLSPQERVRFGQSLLLPSLAASGGLLSTP